jgi:hypothetical protein
MLNIFTESTIHPPWSDKFRSKVLGAREFYINLKACVYLAGCSAAAEKLLLLLLLQLFSPTSATTNNQKKKLQNKQLNTHESLIVLHPYLAKFYLEGRF